METGSLLPIVLSLGQTRKEKCLESPNGSGIEWDADVRLAEDCRQGRLAAYEQLYNNHGARMKSIALNLLGNIPDAEDAVQETFLKIYRNVDRFKGKSAFTTWIYRVLVNSCYDLLRSRRRRRPEVPGDVSEPRARESSLSSASDHPLRLTLEQTLQKLGKRNRTVFLLYEVEGFKHREIAEILDIPEGTSKNLLFEARKELQRLLWKPGQPWRSAHEAGM
jgi:RNA polymerase sigma-70 factor (ECF subfamily)